MSKIKRIVSIMTLLSLLIGAFLTEGRYALAYTIQPPEGAKEFAGQYFHQIVEEVVFSDIPSEWGFKDEKGSITFSELSPIYSLNADFALGKSNEIIADKQPKWVAVIFQDDQPVNAIGAEQKSGGHFELASIGYPPELPSGLLNLKDNELLIHDFPAEEYYVYSEKTNSIMKLEQTNDKYSLSSAQSEKEFQEMLTERYKNIDEWEEDSSGGFISALPSQASASSSNFIIYSVITMLVLGGVFIYFRWHLRARE